METTLNQLLNIFNVLHYSVRSPIMKVIFKLFFKVIIWFSLKLWTLQDHHLTKQIIGRL